MPDCKFPFRTLWLLMVLLTWSLWIGEPTAFGQPARRSPVALDVNTEAIKRLATIEDHVKERQWAQAVLILQQVAADHGEAMIPISSRRYLNVATYCNSILANLPPEGLAVYRDKHDAQARQWLEAGLATRDRALLEKITRQAFVSSFGDDALFWLGEWAWDEGNFAAARDCWRQLLELPDPPDAGQPQPVLRYPDSSFSQALIVARIVLCHIMEGDREQAQSWREYLADQFPEARGELAGRTGIYAEVLAEVLKESETWQFPAQEADTPTFAGNPQRNHISPKGPKLGGVQWQRPLPSHDFQPRTSEGRAEPSLSYFPQVAGNTIYFCDPKRIYALDLLTGEPRWPRIPEADRTEPNDLSTAVIYESPERITRPGGFQVGVPRFTLTVHEHRLYARMGSPVTGQVFIGTASADNHLVCLDLTKEGKVVWTVRPEEVLAGTDIETHRQWAFEGAPAVEGGRVFVGMRQTHPQTEALVACLDAETGRPQWVRRVAASVGGVAERENFVSHLLVTLGENMVFFVPEFGVVTALDARDGRLVWAVTYSSFPPKESKILDDPKKQGLTPAVFHEGVLYVAPTDSESVLAISAKTGVLLWERNIPQERDQIRSVLGVVKNRLVLSGNHLWILNATSGAVEFPSPLPPGSHPVFAGYGRGLVADGAIYWPTRSTIEIRDLAGQRTKQPEPYPGGNLAIAGDLLLCAEPNRLVAYSNFAQIREKERGLISQNPDAALPRWRLALVEEASGEIQTALRLYGEAIAKATPHDQIGGRPLKELALRNRVRLLLRLGKQALADKAPDKAVEHFQTAARSTDHPQTRAEALKLLGTAQIEAQQIPQAVEAFQTILDQPALAVLPSEQTAHPTLGDFAKARIAELIRKHGRDVYAQFDRLAADQIAARLREQNLEAAEDILRQYPNALVTSETRHRLARLKRDRGEPLSAVRIWQELLGDPLLARTRQAVLWELALTLEQEGCFRPARETWRQLAREFPDVSLATNDGPQTASAFISARLSTEDYRGLDRPAPALPLVRRWERDLEPDSRVLLPEGEPPGPEVSLILIVNRGLAAVDPAQGQARWQSAFNAPPLWAAYGPMQLVLGTRNSLSAVSLQTGRTLWEVFFTDPDEPQSAEPEFRLVGDQVLVLEDNEVSRYEISTGRRAWTVHPGGNLSRFWHADADFTAVQTESPLRVLVFETGSGQRLSEHRPPEPWVTKPAPLQSPPPKTLPGPLPDNRGFVAAMRNRQIHAFGAFDPQADPMWTFEGGVSYANAPPRFWSNEEQLLMLMDGDTLVRLAPGSGETLWFRSLSPSPITEPSKKILVEGRRIFAVGNQMVSCLNSDDGRPEWQRPLPAGSEWFLRKSGPFLAVVPWQSVAELSQAVILQGDTGEPVQKLSVPPGAIDADFHRAGSFLVTKNKLLGWGPLE